MCVVSLPHILRRFAILHTNVLEQFKLLNWMINIKVKIGEIQDDGRQDGSEGH